MPITYRPANEGKLHLTLHNFPSDIIDWLDSKKSQPVQILWGKDKGKVEMAPVSRKMVLVDLLYSFMKSEKNEDRVSIDSDTNLAEPSQF